MPRRQTEPSVSAPLSTEAFPVGAVFLSVVADDPADLLGYGTWESIASGRVLVGVDTGDSDFNAAEKTGGSKSASHTHDYSGVIQHTHAVTVTDQGHTHTQSIRNTGTAGTLGVQGASTANNAAIPAGVPSSTTGITASTSNPAGSSASASTTSTSVPTMPPFLAVYIWKRSA